MLLDRMLNNTSRLTVVKTASTQTKPGDRAGTALVHHAPLKTQIHSEVCSRLPFGKLLRATVRSLPVRHIGMYVSSKVQEALPPTIVNWLQLRFP
jgi:hypothetical protein